MKTQNYQCAISAFITPGEAVEKISRVGDWWAVNFKGSAQKPGDSFTVHFARTTWSRMEIVQMEPDRIVWRIADCHLPIFKDPGLWKGNHIVWDIADDETCTRITMTHIGLVPGVECYEDCKKGWNFYVGESLFRWMTEGKGLPGSGIFADVFVEDRKYEGLLFPKAEPFPDFAAGYVVLDVRENRGERVLSAWSVQILDPLHMNPQQFKGDYYVVLENRPASAGIRPLEDLDRLIYKEP